MTELRDLDELDPCRHPAPHTGCTLCGRPLEPAGPWVDWRWGVHDGCGLCGPEGHDNVQPFHVECAAALMRAGYDPYMPDEPWALEETWLKPTLWQAVWQPENITLGDAILARTIYRRLHGDKDDPAVMNPFAANLAYYDSRDEFAATDLDAYAHSLGLDERESRYLPYLLQDDWHGMCRPDPDVRGMDRNQLADRVRRLAADPTRAPWPDVKPKSPSVWE
ncbi:hypothetical protein [Bifidobacterium felsineum]|uniref:hypothetical protein n=1 Tax=Bifidobacterium felsineum TaxID=2045440 RepID=UPI001BDD83EB|nr:hypothetical protein [Bifidobacterium felsineum]MBT1164600.1 hypothetical protein [Bifidobacterium felsineum]